MKKLLIIFLGVMCLCGCGTKNELKDENKVNDTTNIKEENEEKDLDTETNNNEEDSKKGENTQPQKTCTAKKFAQKYKYVYETEEACHKEGESTAFFDITDNVDSRVFTINCDKIVDDCGTTWYGVSYNIYDPEHSTRDDGIVVVYY